jgi:hypothetical protein
VPLAAAPVLHPVEGEEKEKEKKTLITMSTTFRLGSDFQEWHQTGPKFGGGGYGVTRASGPRGLLWRHLVLDRMFERALRRLLHFHFHREERKGMRKDKRK